jgi:N6-adenosine-specific RNA methylase IME4/DNA invertase Pin-like site-specific DNA recombinase
MKTILYARVSTADQTMAHQRAQAEQAGFKLDEVLADHGVSGVSTRLAERPEGKRLFDILRSGDTLVVRWLDRLGRNYADVTDCVREFVRRGVIIRTIINNLTFDGSTKEPMAQAVRDALIGFMAAMAQAQAEAIKEAQRAGIARKLRRMQDEDRRLAIEPPKGKFRTITLDPPWTYRGAPERAQPLYATMSQEELLKLRVGSWADDEAHLYLWSTNADLPNAFALMDRWGFKYLTMLTWCKPTLGLGSYLRTTTEHVLFGVIGRLGTRVRDIGTHFTAPKTIHSEKPDRFFELVERASYPPYLDVFARKQRAGWTVWGNGVDRAA